MRKKLINSTAITALLVMSIGSSVFATSADMADPAQEVIQEEFDDTEWAEEDGWSVSEAAPADYIEYYTWKYDDSDTYFRTYGNKTYAFYDANMNSDGKICFWEKGATDDEINLLDSNGEVAFTMTITDAYEDQPTLTDSENKILSPVDTAMNGTYTCQMNASFLEDQTLTLAAELPFYVSNTVAENLKVGDVLNNTDIDFMGVDVESLEKNSDDLYLINDMYELTYQPAQDAWLLKDGDPVYAQIGSCQLTADSQMKDDAGKELTDLASFLEQHDFVEAEVTVEGGNVTQIQITAA